MDRPPSKAGFADGFQAVQRVKQDANAHMHDAAVPAAGGRGQGAAARGGEALGCKQALLLPRGDWRARLAGVRERLQQGGPRIGPLRHRARPGHRRGEGPARGRLLHRALQQVVPAGALRYARASLQTTGTRLCDNLRLLSQEYCRLHTLGVSAVLFN